ncbi:IclR family transcriptional regulator [Rhodococcus sp. NPDC127530]|uniref:IclR family transcriptional regulator n=1 Tax=unclassified Rhodococcus (in: high G+C Gram-positive bacteria) TaxID=192944 RepID=UPI0036443F9A
MKDESKYLAPAVDTAARVLEFLSRYRTSQSTLSEIASALEVPKSTCLRVLLTLSRHGLVSYSEDSKRYSLGFFAVVLGARAEEGHSAINRARPLMTEIVERSGLTAALVQRVSDDRLMYVAKSDGAAISTVHVSVGNRFPILQVSYGKWYVAFADAEQRDAMVPTVLPTTATRVTPDRATYLAECDALDPHGVLVSRGEYAPGVLAVSIPLVDQRGDLEGVVVALGFSDSFEEDELDPIRSMMQSIAMRCNAHVTAG